MPHRPRVQLGPQGFYPTGRPQQAGDRGALAAALTRVPDRRQLQLDLGTPVTWLACPPPAARHQAAAMRALVRQEWGALPYDATTLPIRVEANRQTGQIESHFPERLSVLIGNPEVFLAWADRLEAAVAHLAEEQGDACANDL